MDASPPAGDGEKLDMLINLLSNMNERIEEAENERKNYSLDERTRMLTTKASKQKSQDDMMSAIDRLSNVQKSKDKLPPKGDSKKVEEKKVDAKVTLAVKKFLLENKGKNYCHKCISQAKNGSIKCEDIQIFPNCTIHKVDGGKDDYENEELENEAADRKDDEQGTPRR